MIIGMVSKPEHCQVHARALEGEGHEVRLLGGGPITEFPPSLEVIVVRTSSCSHGASEVAFVYSKKKNIPLVVRDGLTSIRTEIAKIAKKKMPTNPSWSMRPKPQEPLVLEVPVPQPTLEEKIISIFGRFADPMGSVLSNDERLLFEKFKGFPGQLIGYGQQIFAKSNLPLPSLGAFENLYRSVAGEPMVERIGRVIYAVATYLHNLSGDQYRALGQSLVDYDDALENDPRTKVSCFKPGVRHPPYSGMPSHFTAVYMMAAPPGVVIRRRTFMKAYRLLTEGRAIDPVGFIEMKEAFGFLVENPGTKEEPKTFVQTDSVSLVDAPSEETRAITAPSGVLDSVQEEILKVGVRVEDITKRFEEFRINTNETFYEAGKKAGEASQGIHSLQDEVTVLRLSLSNFKKLHEEEIAKLHGFILDSNNRESAIRAEIATLKARLDEKPVAPTSSFDEFLERLTKMGASVNISIPAKS